MKKYFPLLLILMLTLSCQSINKEITVSVKSLQVPVLINKSNNPVCRIQLTKPESVSEAKVKSMHFSIQGGEIQTARLWYMGTDTLLEDANIPIKFEEVQHPDESLILNGELDLQSGENTLLLCVDLDPETDLNHTFFIICEKIEFADGSIWRNTNPVEIKHRLGVSVRDHMDDNVHTYRIPGLDTTNKGTLLAIYDARRESGRDLQGDIDIGLSRSTDNGQTWEPMRVVLDMGEWGGLPQKYNGVSDACILVDKNSDKIFVAGLWMYGVLDTTGKWIKGLDENSTAWEHQWSRKGSQPGWDVKQTAQLLITESSDDGQSWNKPRNLTRMVKEKDWWLWTVAPGHGITLDDGTLVLPGEGRDESGVAFSNIAYSKDGGLTWKSSNFAGTQTNENMVVQLADGSLLSNMRYPGNRGNMGDDNGRVVSVSHDLGETWNEHPTSRNALIEPACMASLHKHIYLENGEQKQILLFSNPSDRNSRHHITLKASFDDGETWPKEHWLLLDEGRGRGYSCITSVDDKNIGILYESSRADLVFQRIPLEDIIRSEN